MSSPTVRARIETWAIAGEFRIARGAKTEAVVVVVEIQDGRHTGRGECVPYARYGETPEATLAQIRAAPACADRLRLLDLMPAGAARNALDCALWDLEAKRSGRSAVSLAGLDELAAAATFFTLSIDTPAAMAGKADQARRHSLLKLKLGSGDGQDALRMRAVRRARPDARLAVDANEGWGNDAIAPLLATAAEAGVEVVEQPLPANADSVLAGMGRAVPICADESVHTSSGLDRLRDRYDAVNIKLDKAGGLTEALRMADLARRIGFKVMIGSMVATSLAIAPAFLLAQQADWVDLDGPLLLARDRPDGFRLEAGMLLPPLPALWG